MSDTNKLLAAILTAGRVPTLDSKNPRPMEDWLAEYNSWVNALNSQDLETKKAEAEAYTKHMVDAVSDHK